MPQKVSNKKTKPGKRSRANIRKRTLKRTIKRARTRTRYNVFVFDAAKIHPASVKMRHRIL